MSLPSHRVLQIKGLRRGQAILDPRSLIQL